MEKNFPQSPQSRGAKKEKISEREEFERFFQKNVNCGDCGKAFEKTNKEARCAFFPVCCVVRVPPTHSHSADSAPAFWPGSDKFVLPPPAVPSRSRRACPASLPRSAGVGQVCPTPRQSQAVPAGLCPASIGRRCLALSLSARLRLPPGGSPGLSLSEKSNLLLFFWEKTEKTRKN